MAKPFQLGLLVGRFQTFHTGHESMVRTALALCENVGVLIGSSQEHGTVKNPFPWETRAAFFKKVFGESIMLAPLPDIGVGNTAKWGEYVLQNAVSAFGRLPDLLVSGKEERRIDWFDSAPGAKVAELYIPKTIEISASQMRAYFTENDFERWKQFMDPVLWSEFEPLRALVLAARGHTETESV